MTGMERVCFQQEKLSPLREWSPYFEQHHPNPAITVFRALAASAHCVATPDIGIYPEYYREFIAAFERVRLLEAPPEAALNFAQKRLDESWARYVRSLQRHGQALPVAITNSR
jgi:hypothetical protein